MRINKNTNINAPVYAFLFAKMFALWIYIVYMYQVYKYFNFEHEWSLPEKLLKVFSCPLAMLTAWLFQTHRTPQL